MVQVPVPTPIYHITDVENLPAILDAGCLSCKNELLRCRQEHASIAYEHIQERRARIPVLTGGNLHDYVPFHFAPRSPMLYTISRGNVEGRTQGNIVHLVTEAQLVALVGPYAFTDGHATMDRTEQYRDLHDLSHVDWVIMRARIWKNEPHDNDRKRRRQAEFLVRGPVPWSMITKVAVRNQVMVEKVHEILNSRNQTTLVEARPEWYY